MEQLLVHDQDLLWETFVLSDVMTVLTLSAVPLEFAKVIRPGVEQKQLVYQVSVTKFLHLIELVFIYQFKATVPKTICTTYMHMSNNPCKNYPDSYYTSTRAIHHATIPENLLV